MELHSYRLIDLGLNSKYKLTIELNTIEVERIDSCPNRLTCGHWQLDPNFLSPVTFVSDYALISGCKPQEDSNLRPWSKLATVSSPLGSLIPQIGFKGNSVALIRNVLQ